MKKEIFLVQIEAIKKIITLATSLVIALEAISENLPEELAKLEKVQDTLVEAYLNICKIK